MSTLTVRDLFLSTATGELDAGLRLPPPPDGVAQLFTEKEWQGVGDRVLDLLDLNVVDLLLGGWKSHQEVRRQLRATAADPSRHARVHLAHHTVRSTHAPSIEFRFQGKTLVELTFPMELAFEIAAVELLIREGAIREIRPGDVKCRGTVKLEHTVLLQRELSPVRLPGAIDLDANTRERDTLSLRVVSGAGV